MFAPPFPPLFLYSLQISGSKEKGLKGTVVNQVYLGFPANENFGEKRRKFAKNFFNFSQNVLQNFAKINLAKYSKNDAEFCEKMVRNFAIFCESFAFTFCETDFFSQRTECEKAAKFSQIDFPIPWTP